MVRYRAASAMAPIPFDRHGVPGTLELVDDFVSFGADFVLSSTGAVLALSDLTWVGDSIAADATMSIVVAESDHQGIVKITGGGTTGNAWSLALGRAANGETDEAFFIDANGLYLATVCRIATLADTIFEFGLAVTVIADPNSAATDTVGWVFENADTAGKFIAQMNGAGTVVEQASVISYTANDWVLLEIAADTSGATFRITTEDDTETIVLDGADGAVVPIVALRPRYVAEAAGSAAAVVDIDVFALRYIRRQSLVAKWLGQ